MKSDVKATETQRSVGIIIAFCQSVMYNGTEDQALVGQAEEDRIQFAMMSSRESFAHRSGYGSMLIVGFL